MSEKEKWSGIYDNSMLEALENPQARKEIKEGAIDKLIDAGFLRKIKIGDKVELEFSTIFLDLLENDNTIDLRY